jgi:hypothetical protein
MNNLEIESPPHFNNNVLVRIKQHVDISSELEEKLAVKRSPIPIWI